MDKTANLSLPYIMPSQAQKHVTHNESLGILDALVQLAVADRDLAAPPPTPAAGARYIVSSPATGAWAGREDQVAHFQDGGWTFLSPNEGYLAWVVDEGQLVSWADSSWTPIGEAITELQNLALLGIGTTADPTNPFAAKLNKALWTAKTAAEGGDGNLRYTLNKETAANVLSLLFQRGFSGRAEFGLIGDDDIRLKVSADGSSWHDALSVDRTTGKVAASGVANSADVQTFTVSGTWTKPAGAKLIQRTLHRRRRRRRRWAQSRGVDRCFRRRRRRRRFELRAMVSGNQPAGFCPRECRIGGCCGCRRDIRRRWVRWCSGQCQLLRRHAGCGVLRGPGRRRRRRRRRRTYCRRRRWRRTSHWRRKCQRRYARGGGSRRWTCRRGCQQWRPTGKQLRRWRRRRISRGNDRRRGLWWRRRSHWHWRWRWCRFFNRKRDDRRSRRFYHVFVWRRRWRRCPRRRRRQRRRWRIQCRWQWWGWRGRRGARPRRRRRRRSAVGKRRRWRRWRRTARVVVITYF